MMKKYIVILFLCQMLTAQQKPESGVSKFFKNIFTCGAGFEAARPDYVERSRQAQREMGIPEHKMAKTYMSKNEDTNGQATLFGIHLHHDKLDNRPYGFQRFTMLHEAAHVKNNDCIETTKEVWVALFYGLLLIGSPGAAFTTFEIKCLPMKRKQENRADKAAALALQCSPCLKERMLYKHSQESISDHGYMSNAEFQPILDGYIRDNKICEIHDHIGKLQRAAEEKE